MGESGAEHQIVTGARAAKAQQSKSPSRRWAGLISAAALTWLSLAPLGAQVDAPDPASEVEEVSPAVELKIPEIELRGGWLELTPLDRPQLAPTILELPDRQSGQSALILGTDLTPGYTMVCSGGESWAVTCEPVYLDDVWTNEVRFEGGWEVVGGYLLNDLPIVGARVAVVPLGFESERPYTMPLAAPAGRRLPREVETDAEGRFALPPIAGGDYLLEAVLPSGRVHRAEIQLPSLPDLELPPDATIEDAVEAATRQRFELPALDLGMFSLDEGLATEIRVLDEVGLPVPGARIGATEGLRPRDAVTFEATADAGGVARISGFTVDRPVRLTCQAPGFDPAALYFEQIPALVECTIERLAQLRGEVLGIDGGAPAGGTLALDLVAPDAEGDAVSASETRGTEISGRSGRARQIALAADGRFAIPDLVAGSYSLAIVAPGYATDQRTIELEPGADLDLGAIVLLAAPEMRGRVVDAQSGEPLAGIAIESINPPGAASATSDQDGEFRLSFPATEAMVLRLGGVEHAPREIRVLASQLEEREPLVIALEKGGWIAVTVYNSAGLRCQACRVVIQPIGEELLTDALGGAHSGVLRAANYRLERPRFSHLGSTVIEQPAAETRLVKVRAGRVTRVVLGESGRRTTIRFSPSPGPRWTLSLRSGHHQERFNPESDGTFRVKIRPTAPHPDVYLHLFDAASGAEFEIWQARVRGPSSSLTLALPDTEVEARLFSNGQPLARREVTLHRFDSRLPAGRVRTDTQGHLRIPHLPAGTYILSLGHRLLSFVSVQSGRSVDLGRFELPPGSF